MEQLQALLDELDTQLATAARLSANRAEFLRLQQMTATVTKIRAEAAILQLAPTG